MFERGTTQAEVARRLGVSRQSASRWYESFRTDGAAGLRSTEPPGRPARLSQGQLREIEGALLKGARTHGFATDLWTLDRVVTVIERQTGVRYSIGHVWKLLSRMGWSLQRPARRAVERDDRAIRRWKKKEWPRVKKTPENAAPGWPPGGPWSLSTSCPACR